jgi:hypothetical protein
VYVEEGWLRRDVSGQHLDRSVGRVESGFTKV